MPDLSIIIASWNARQLLLDCLQSIELHREGIDLEIIVVDNASSDGSPDAVAESFPEVHLIRNETNLGFAAANNLGIAKSRGRYLALVNSDILIEPGCFAELIDYMDAHPAVGLVAPRILNVDRTLQVSCRKFPSLWNSFCRALALDRMFPRVGFLSGSFMNYWAHDEERSVDVVTACFCMARREVVEKVGGLDEGYFMYSEDVDWCKRIRDAGWIIMLDPLARAIHLGGGSSSNAPTRFFVEMQKAQLRYWEKHHGKFKKNIYKLIILFQDCLRLIPRSMLYLVSRSRRPALGKKMGRDIASIRWLLGLEGANRP